MDMSQLKAIESRAQLITIIEKASFFGGDIWQYVVGAKPGRTISQIIEILTDLTSDRPILRSPTLEGINPNLPVFVRLNYRNLIFKLLPGQYTVSGDNMISLYPEEARALEERQGGDRYVLPFGADISLSLKRIERSFKDLSFEMELRIIDVSARGFGIMISAQNKDCLKKNDHFWINSIDHTALPNPIFGTVCYTDSRGYYTKRGDVRVGVKLSRPLAADVLGFLKKRSKIILTA